MARVIDTARNSRFLLAALVLGHLVLISRQVDGGGGTSLLGRVVLTLLTPAQRAVAGVVRGIAGAWTGYVDLRAVREDNDHLRRRVQNLEMLLQQKQERAQEADRLREVLDLRQILPFETVVAEVVARDGLPWFRTLTLNKGTRAGVVLDAPVITSWGVVGRVVAVGPYAARVQLLIDRDSGVGVLIERSRVAGVVSGQIPDARTPQLVMKYVPSVADVEPGDVVVTSGLDRLFPKGLLVGRVASVGPPTGLFREIQVTPSARFEQVEEVLIVKASAEPATLTQSVRSEGKP
jgi:rod shape-determining protein MreC